MISPDAINGGYELLGGLMIAVNVLRLIKDKAVKGVSIGVSAFFTTWAFWNLYYYPHLGQWFSFAGGLFIMVANATWLTLAVWYSRREAKNSALPPV